MEIVKLKGADFGIEETKAQEISAQFKPMLDKMVELEKEYNRIIRLPKDKPDTAEQAGELRKKLVKVRTGTAEIHKAQKAFYLAGGRFVDAWKNAQLFASQGLEEKLLEIETYRQRIELERVQKLHDERLAFIRPYIDEADLAGLSLGAMQDDVWEAYSERKKKNWEDLKRAEAEAEAKRIEAEKRAELEAERKKALAPYREFIADFDIIEFADLPDGTYDQLLHDAKFAHDERVRKNQLAQDRTLSLRPFGNFVPWGEIDLAEMPEKEFKELLKRVTKADADYREQLAKQEAENKRLQAEADKKEKARLAELEKERKAREKLEAELKAKREAEAKAEAERKAKAQAEAKAKADAEAKAKAEAEALAKAGDKAVLKNWVEALQLDLIAEEKLGEHGYDTACDIYNKFLSFKKWAYAEIDKV